MPNNDILKLTWRDIFDSYKVFPYHFGECVKIAKSVNYDYLAFNGIVYSVLDLDMKNPICNIEDLR